MSRRTGKTSRALASLPDGSIYVVAHHAERRRCEDLLRLAGRKPDCMRIVVLDELERRARGLPRLTHFDVDHAIYDWDMATPRQREALALFGKRYVVPAPAD